MKTEISTHQKRISTTCLSLFYVLMLTLFAFQPSAVQASGLDGGPRWGKTDDPYDFLEWFLADYGISIGSVADTLCVSKDPELRVALARAYRVPVKSFTGTQTVGELLTSILERKIPRRHSPRNDFRRIRYSSDYHIFVDCTMSLDYMPYMDEILEKQYSLFLLALWKRTVRLDTKEAYLFFLEKYDSISAGYCEHVLKVESEECVYHHSRFTGYDKIACCQFARAARERLAKLTDEEL